MTSRTTWTIFLTGQLERCCWSVWATDAVSFERVCDSLPETSPHIRSGILRQVMAGAQQLLHPGSAGPVPGAPQSWEPVGISWGLDQIKQGRGFWQLLSRGLESEPGVAAVLRRPQPAQAVPVRDLPTRQETRQRPSRGRRRTARRLHNSDYRETGPTRAFTIVSNSGRLLTQPQRQVQSSNPQTGC